MPPMPRWHENLASTSPQEALSRLEWYLQTYRISAQQDKRPHESAAHLKLFCARVRSRRRWRRIAPMSRSFGSTRLSGAVGAAGMGRIIDVGERTSNAADASPSAA